MDKNPITLLRVTQSLNRLFICQKERINQAKLEEREDLVLGNDSNPRQAEIF